MPSGRKRYTQEEFVRKAGKKNPRLEVVGIYEHSNLPVRIRCRTCGNEWDIRAKCLLSRNVTCRVCRMREDGEWFAETMQKKNKSIRITGKYQGIAMSIQAKCVVCGNEWVRKPYYFLGHPACPECKKQDREFQVYPNSNPS